MESTLEVELINAKLYDFKLDSGDVIKGIKLYYFDNTIKDGSIKGDILDTFLSVDKIPDYERVFETLKNYCKECKERKVAPMIILSYTIKSINSKPIITKIDLKK